MFAFYLRFLKLSFIGLARMPFGSILISILIEYRKTIKQRVPMKNCCNKKPFLYIFYKFIIMLIIVIICTRYLYENSSLFFRKSFVLPFSTHLNENDLYLVKGEEFKLTVFTFNQWVSYTSTNFRVAGVNFNGRVFGYHTGKAFIIVKVKNKELRCRVHVIDLNKKSLILKEGERYRLRLKGANASVGWKSSNKEVAKVSFFGNVKAVSKGETTIYAKVKGKTLKCKVRVE